MSDKSNLIFAGNSRKKEKSKDGFFLSGNPFNQVNKLNTTPRKPMFHNGLQRHFRKAFSDFSQKSLHLSSKTKNLPSSFSNSLYYKDLIKIANLALF